MCCTPDIILHFVTEYSIEEDVEFKRMATGTALKKNTKYGSVWCGVHIFWLHNKIILLVSDGLMALLSSKTPLMHSETTSLSIMILDFRFSRFSLFAVSGFVFPVLAYLFFNLTSFHFSRLPPHHFLISTTLIQRFRKTAFFGNFRK